MPTLDINGATISYTDTGSPPARPNAPTVLFGHGLLFGGWMFDAQIDALRSDYHCLAIDWRGQGDSRATEGFDMDTLTSDVVTFIARLGISPVHYVGLSMGGFVGLRLGVRHGGLLRSLTLLDTSADPEPAKSAVQDKLLASVYRLTGMNKLLASQVLPIMFGPTFRRDPANRPLLDEFVRRLQEADRRPISDAVLAVANRDGIYPAIDAITVPTLVIVGADDRPTPVKKAQRIATRIPGARLEVVPHSGHSSTVEQPAAITKLLADFLTALG
jgi:pimeloyl-ACP methyl ester carboxylesterase